VPANRSRTENWRRSLDALHEKGGALEIALVDPDARDSDPHSPDLIWRVRILGLSDSEIVVEQPMALGHLMPINSGAALVGIIAVGQNRWMFKTSNLGPAQARLGGGRQIPAIRLRLPDDVERCQRRHFYRISTIGLRLPEVECYTLLDPDSAVLAETANRVEILEFLHAARDGRVQAPSAQPVLPKVGPSFTGTLVNVGGGGAGLLFEEQAHRGLDSSALFWMRITLTPHIPLPLAVTARARHTYLNSAQQMYAGMAFEFGYHPQHQRFVVDQLLRYVSLVQREQMSRRQQAA